ncbi:glycoside hydrolase family 130 protein [Sphingomonas sp. gentR]|uniref:glycoside hydrolase family 130 protein n=1 Tax=unclassified Sphingomonas TaxID=196159 RepID=UPI0009728314|nr:glycoside hydrolase family 130 protein [Sphingomonas sp. LK11]APX66063.1 glycosidase [Sphingomonas sp. LK11]
MNAADVFTKLDVELKPDPSRTVIRPFRFDYPEAFDRKPSRAECVARHVMALDPATRDRMLDLLHDAMRQRHRNVDNVFLRRFDQIKADIGDIGVERDCDRLLLGAYFSQEYAFESAALFNPSIVTLPDQDPDDQSIRFLLSLRGVGEGHISSVTFRTGTWDGATGLTVDAASSQGVPPRIDSEDGEWVRMRADDSQDISETVIFPILPTQRSGIEDLRLVHFTDHDGVRSVIGTYTAFDGQTARCELLRGINEQSFEMRPLTGRLSGYKGMALFPRRIGDRFAMIGRQDNVNLWLLYSDDLHIWDEGMRIMGPQYPWEFVQIGNCGSPIEIDEGWLVFTHGVGMVRGYCVGACLLDKDNPAKVLARTHSPILFPSAEQRGGYVPNVTYSCGALLHKRHILLPYAIGDQYTAFATGSVDDLLSVMV